MPPNRTWGNRYTTDNPRRALTPGARVTADELEAIVSAASKRHVSVGELIRQGLIAIGVLRAPKDASK